KVGRILADVLLEDLVKDNAQDGRHGERIQERPTNAQHRPPVTAPQIEPHQREPEVTTAPDAVKIVAHVRASALSGVSDHAGALSVDYRPRGPSIFMAKRPKSARRGRSGTL